MKANAPKKLKKLILRGVSPQLALRLLSWRLAHDTLDEKIRGGDYQDADLEEFGHVQKDVLAYCLSHKSASVTDIHAKLDLWKQVVSYGVGDAVELTLPEQVALQAIQELGQLH